MSLLEYDIIDNKIDKSKSWIDISKQIIYSRIIKHRYRYYSLANRYDNKTNSYTYYIIHSINQLKGSRVLYFDDFNRAKIRINSIFNLLGFTCKDKNRNIHIELIEEMSDYDVYSITC